MNIIENIKSFFKKISNDNISEYTAQCAYYTILSFIPFLILVVTLVQYTPISKEMLISIIQQIIPTTMIDATIDIVQEVYSKSIGTVSISLIFVLWSSGKGFYALSKGIQNIYKPQKEFNYFYMKLVSIICTILLVIIIILTLLISVFGNSIVEMIHLKWNIPIFVYQVLKITRVGIYFVLFLIILIMYRFISNSKVSLKSHIPGAIIATLGWYVVSLFFSLYIEAYVGFSVVYGNLTTITLAMMWLYICMYFILIGAEFNKILCIEKNKKI